MQTKCARLVTVVFSGITVTDDFGYGDVNRSYTIDLNPHSGKPSCTYLYNAEENGVLIMVEVTTSPDGNWVNYDLTKASDLNNTQHIFDANGPVQGNVIPNSLLSGGTATIS